MSKVIERPRKAAKAKAHSGVRPSLYPTAPKRSTGQIIQGLRDEYGLDQDTIKRLTGYSKRSIISWGKGKKAQKPAEMKFTELNRLFEALADLTQNREEVADWLETPNEAFEGSTPLQVIERGESDRLWRMVYFLRSGDPS